jgi:hypothetical protein
MASLVSVLLGCLPEAVHMYATRQLQSGMCTRPAPVHMLLLICTNSGTNDTLIPSIPLYQLRR